LVWPFTSTDASPGVDFAGVTSTDVCVKRFPDQGWSQHMGEYRRWPSNRFEGSGDPREKPTTVAAVLALSEASCDRVFSFAT
jgi:hypothetical protein